MNIFEKTIKGVSSFVSSVLWCLSLSWKSSKLYTIIRILSVMLTPLVSIVIALISKHIINILAGIDISGNIHERLIALLIFLLAVSLLGFFTQKMNQYCSVIHDETIGKRISMTMMESALTIDLEYFDNPEYHDMLLAAGRDSYAAPNIVWNVLTCISALVSFIGVFLILSQENLFYGFLILIVAIPSSLASIKYTKLLYNLNLEQINAERKMNYYQNISFEKSHAQDIRLFNASSWIKNRYLRLWENLFQKRRNMTKKRAVITGLLDCLPEIVVGLISIDIALKVLNKSATVGDYSLYTRLIGQLLSAISMLLYSIVQIYDNRLKIENVKSIEYFAKHIIDEGQLLLEKVESIKFDHVCFTYPGLSECVLDDICLDLHCDEKVALVGLNGSGKSTLIKLLLRMYNPLSGTILINNVDICEYKLSSLHANFSVYFQGMNNYSFTLRENFAISDDKHPNADEAIESALNASYSNDILKKASNSLDAGLTRYFDSNGIELSGGQHQKLAIARVLFRRHTALILDEPSANLDPRAEHEIFKSLEERTKGKMTIFTSHRLSNISLADRIIVLENGKIVEDGTQKELLQNKKRYAELFRYQQEKYFTGEEKRV